MTEDELAQFQAADARSQAVIAAGYSPETQAAIKAWQAKNMNRWALPTTGNLSYDDYMRAQENYGKAAWGQPTALPSSYINEGTEYVQQVGGGNAYNDKMGEPELWGADWMSTLTPEQRAEYWRLSDETHAKRDRNGKLAAAAAFAGIGGLGALANPGMFSSFMGSLGAAPGVAAGGDLGMAGWMGTGAGPMGIEAGAAGLAGGGAGAGGAMSGEYLGPLLDSLGSGGGWAGGMPSGVDLGALGGIMQTGGSSNGWLGKLLGGILGGGQQQGGGIGNLLGTGGLGLLSQYYNNSKMPGIPDFMKLAQMTGASANPNQTNAQGDSLNWAVDPATGQRTQTVKYGASNQKAFDEQQAMAQALRSKIMTRPAAAPMQQVDLSNLWG
jgi:hypothetical protein